MCHKPWCQVLCSPLRTHPSQDREAQSLQRTFCAQRTSNRSSPVSCTKRKPTEMHNYWHFPIFNGPRANFCKATSETLQQWVNSVSLKTLFYHCNEIVQNWSSRHCVDWRKSSPRIKLLKSLHVLALSQTPWPVYGQGHKFLGFPFPICEGNIIIAFPFSYFLLARLVTE